MAGLARTGGGATLDLVQLASAVLLAGGGMLLATRRRRIVYPFKR